MNSPEIYAPKPIQIVGVAAYDKNARVFTHKNYKWAKRIFMGGKPTEGESYVETAIREGREEFQMPLNYITFAKKEIVKPGNDYLPHTDAVFDVTTVLAFVLYPESFVEKKDEVYDGKWEHIDTVIGKNEVTEPILRFLTENRDSIIKNADMYKRRLFRS